MVHNSKATQKLAKRLLERLAPEVVSDIRTEASKMNLRFSLSSNLIGDTLAVTLSGDRLLEHQFGSLDRPPEYIVTQLLNTVADNRRLFG